MLFIAIGQHSPAQCPGFDKETFDMVSNTMPKLDDIGKKNNVKILNIYGMRTAHKTVIVMEAPSHEAAEMMLVESRFAAWNTVELNQAHSMEESMKLAAELHSGQR